MSEIASLTESEAVERFALVSVQRYDIEVDLTALLEGPRISSRSTISFSCTSPGADTFVDCVATISGAALNGVELDPATARAGRLPLPDLEAENVLVVEASTDQTHLGAGVLRTVDPSDKLVYLWTSFEADDARRVWACFDQPDLKAPHAFVVTAPESWTVTSNSPVGEVTPVLGQDARVWTFPDTPPLSTYVVVINAGPFHELRSGRRGYDLGLYCRQSLRQFLDRDAEELFDLTDRGLSFFGERFGSPFPQVRYDQVFVPNMGGAMENWGCVTWSDAVLYRSDPTYQQRAGRASVLMHEMAHMWFGDLVTMKWWDDLWLNEAFASWAATWALAGATEEFSDAWASFAVAGKLEGYRQDMGGATHPIRGRVPDVAHAMANFDAITYIKGQSVLRQLVAYVGEDNFVEGLRAYFRDHAWGNTRLADLIDSVAVASGRDLSAWSPAWFDRSGTDTHTLTGDRVETKSPDDDEPRPHRFRIASFAVGDDGLTPAGVTAVETNGTSTPVSLPEADLHLLNADDLTFAAVRTDPASAALLTERAGQLPDATSRALAVSTAWDMLLKGETTPAAVVDTLTSVLTSERSPAVVEPFLTMATRVAELWAHPDDSPALLQRVADAVTGLAETPEHRQPALRTLAATATTPAHLDLVAEGAETDRDLAWRLAARRAELGDYDDDDVRRMLEADPDPDAWVRALGVTASREVPEAKQEVWNKVFEDRSVPAGMMLFALGERFWRPRQAEVLRPFTGAYLERLDRLDDTGLLALGSLLRAMYPQAVADQGFLDQAQEIAARPGTHPSVRSVLLFGGDTTARILRARELRSPAG